MYLLFIFEDTSYLMGDIILEDPRYCRVLCDLNEALGEMILLPTTKFLFGGQALFLCDEARLNRLDDFIMKYKSIRPELLKLKHKFLKYENKYIAVTNANITQLEKAAIEIEMLRRHNVAIEDKEIKFLNTIIENYRMSSLGYISYKIGNPDKQERVCRFCGLSVPDVTFNSTAHAISNNLGNSKVILHDECDICNSIVFSKLENSISNFFMLQKFIYTKKENIETEDFIAIKIDGKKILPIFKRYTKKSAFKTRVLNSKYKCQDVYKMFCKFFLSVIDDSELHHFKRTINWLKGESTYSLLPKIAVIQTPMVNNEPVLDIYLRKNEMLDFPYAFGIFYIYDQRFLFIVPFCDNDKFEFIDEAELAEFKRIIGFFHKAKWRYHDFSSIISDDVRMMASFPKNNFQSDQT